MHVVIRTIDRIGGPSLALSIALFAAAGASNTALDADVHSAFAVTLVVAGCYAMARHANRVTRKRLALLAGSLWVAFLAISPLHVVGVGAVAAAVPAPTDGTVIALEALTWSTLLAAGVSTVFLGFREYGSETAADRPEDILDGDVDV